jgi:hypothetical protein
MKKAMLRKLRSICNEVLGEKETEQIIQETVDKTVKEVLEDTKPKTKKKKSDD